MADDVQDILICTSTDTGSEWTSLSELTAGVVDAKLPIESVDATVKLDGASSVFTVSTGGAARVTIDSNGNIVANGGEIRTDSPITTKASANLDASIQFYGKNYLLRSRDGLGYAVTMGANYDPAFNNLRYLGETGTFAIRNYVADADSVLNVCNRNINRAATIDFSRGDILTDSDKSKRWASISNPDRYKGLEYRVYSSSAPETWTNAPPHVFYATAPSDATGAEYEILRMLWNRVTVSTGGQERVTITDTAAIFKSQIQTPSVRGLADNDAEITMGSSVQIESSDQVPFAINSTADNCYFSLRVKTNPKTFIGLLGEDLVVSAGSNGAIQLRITPDESVKVPSQLQTNSIHSLLNETTDAAITLGNQATLKQGDGSEYVPTDSASIATKKIVDDKIWVGTTASYNSITKNPTTLYCLTD